MSYATFIVASLWKLFTVISVRYPTTPPNAALAIPNNTTVAIIPIAAISGIIPIATNVAPTAPNNNAKPIVHPLEEVSKDCFCCVEILVICAGIKYSTSIAFDESLFLPLLLFTLCHLHGSSFW